MIEIIPLQAASNRWNCPHSRLRRGGELVQGVLEAVAIVNPKARGCWSTLTFAPE